MKKRFTQLVRYLTRWAWTHEIEVTEGVASIKEVRMADGQLDVGIKFDSDVHEYIGKCFASMIAGSPNYTEMKFEFVVPGKFEWINVHVQKGNGKTPHQLRQIAEEHLRLNCVVLRACRDTFKQYADLHYAKGTEEGKVKGDANQSLHVLCREQLIFVGAEPTPAA